MNRHLENTERSRSAEYQYLNLLEDILKNGVDKPVFNNPGVTIRSVFGRQMRFDLSRGFPLLTTKKVFIRGIIHELLWFLRGDSNIKYLVDNDVHIWDEWAYKRFMGYKISNKNGKIGNWKLEIGNSGKIISQEEFIKRIKEDNKFASRWGELGDVYGVQWRRWPASDGRKIDQLGWAIRELKTTPFRKSILVSAWNPEYIYEMAAPGKSMALAPCHTLFQFNVTRGRLSLQLYQRSADMFLGVPFNIASYSLLTLIIAQVTKLGVGEFVHTFGDAHIYSNHFAQVKEQLKRKPRPFPKIRINSKVKNIDEFQFNDFEIMGYNPHPSIKGEVTVVGGF